MDASKYEYQSEFARRYYGQGKADGKAAGVAEMVLKQLATRFGTLSPAVATRVQSASAAELDRIALQVLTAQTLDEALGTL
jgi:Rod binding domain-containing protein